MGQIGNTETQMIFVDAFLQNIRLDNILHLMGYHPAYLEKFIKTQNVILRGDGPVPYHYRHYIAIMAAGRHQCSYLIHHEKREFLRQGGDANWLKGLDYIPKKLRSLYEINKLLAHRPWLVNRHHIEKLTKSGWALGEAFHAIVLLTHFHALSSFVFGCRISSESDQESGSTIKPSLLNGWSGWEDGSPPKNAPGCWVETLMKKMKAISEQLEDPTQEETVQQFERVDLQTLKLCVGGDTIPSPKAEVSCYIEDPEFVYEEYPKDIPAFRIHDYSWDSEGYCLSNMLFSDLGTILDEKFSKTYNLTYGTIGDKRNVNTSLFRRAIWTYIQSIYGIVHDDYNYGEVDQLLDPPLKNYITTVCCYPERSLCTDFDVIFRELHFSEKIHINLMVLEARLQAELLFALRAISGFMTRRLD